MFSQFLSTWDWHDWWRLLILVHCIVCIFIFAQRQHKFGHEWNVKTTDYWFGYVAWCSGAAILVVEGVVLNHAAGPHLVAITAAVLVTARGLNRPGNWGGRDYKKVR